MGIEMGAVIGIEVRAVDRAAWDAATAAFQKTLGRGAGKPAPAAAAGAKTPPLAPAADDAGEGRAGPPAGPGGAP